MNLKIIEQKIEKLLKPKGAPVAIKFLESKETLKEKEIMPLEANRALCQLLKMVAVYEKTRGVYLENIDACVVGSYVMGFKLPPEDIKERWIKGFGYTEERFNQLSEKIEALPQNKYQAAVFGPLAEFDNLGIKPDSVVLLLNSCQSYLALVGYFDATGKKPESNFNGHAACEVIAAAAQGKSPWLTIPCGGARSIADSQDDEIWLGLTVEHLETIIGRLETIGLKYPPAIIQMPVSDLNPDHPLTDLLVRDVENK